MDLTITFVYFSSIAISCGWTNEEYFLMSVVFICKFSLVLNIFICVLLYLVYNKMFRCSLFPQSKIIVFKHVTFFMSRFLCFCFAYLCSTSPAWVSFLKRNTKSVEFLKYLQPSMKSKNLKISRTSSTANFNPSENLSHFSTLKGVFTLFVTSENNSIQVRHNSIYFFSAMKSWK